MAILKNMTSYRVKQHQKILQGCVDFSKWHSFGHSEIEHREYFDLHDIKTSRGDKIRTYGPSHPIRVRYQTAPHPDNTVHLSRTIYVVKCPETNQLIKI